jgi:hypothetical protein
VLNTCTVAACKRPKEQNEMRYAQTSIVVALYLLTTRSSSGVVDQFDRVERRQHLHTSSKKKKKKKKMMFTKNRNRKSIDRLVIA